MRDVEVARKIREAIEEFREQHDGKDYHTVFMGVCHFCNGLFVDSEEGDYRG